MVNTERVYWELLNNEIRKVTVDPDTKVTTLSTRFRTIQNELKFSGVIWSDNLELMTGCLLNYVQEINSDNITDDIKKHFKDVFHVDYSFEGLREEGQSLYKIVCERNQAEFLILAGKMKICIGF
ncbi:MAG: hypothetical protein K6E32_06760 [Lachnospiraceae bacterium]|nr:hypothetical protein [Lachnospiraceae bacterium]